MLIPLALEGVPFQFLIMKPLLMFRGTTPHLDPNSTVSSVGPLDTFIPIQE